MNGAGSGIMKIVVTARRSSTCQQSFMHLGSRCRRIRIQRTVWLQREFEASLGYTRSASQNKINQKNKNKNLFNQWQNLEAMKEKDKHRNLKYFHDNYIKNNISKPVVCFWGNLPILKTDDASCVRIPDEFTTGGIKTNSRKKGRDAIRAFQRLAIPDDQQPIFRCQNLFIAWECVHRLHHVWRAHLSLHTRLEIYKCCNSQTKTLFPE